MISKKNKLEKFKEIIFFSRKFLTIVILSICIIFFWKNVKFIEYFDYIRINSLLHLTIFFLIFLFFESILFKKIIEPFIKIGVILSYKEK